MINRKTYLLLFYLVMMFLVSAIPVESEIQTSPNYRIEADVITTGGDYSYSLNYDLFDIIGQPSVIGLSTSWNFYNYAGFLYALEGTINKYHVSGSGYNYPEPGFRASLALNVLEGSLEIGWLKYYYSRLPINLISTSITGLSVVGNTVTILGECTINGVAGYKFTAIIIDDNYDAMGITIYKPDGTLYFQSTPAVMVSGNFNIDSVASCHYPVKIIRSTPLYHLTLQSAYDAAVNGDVIQSQYISFSENINANRNISVTLIGGYDCNYIATPYKTTLNGQMTISSGTVLIENYNLE